MMQLFFSGQSQMMAAAINTYRHNRCGNEIILKSL